MKCKLPILAIVIILSANICPNGYCYDSILVLADDTQEILKSSSSMKSSAKNEIGSFLNKNGIRNIDDYAHWLNKNMRYQTGNFDGGWESWQATLNRGYGDCKNLSVLSSKVLEYFGYRPMLIGYKNPEGGHLFTAFFKDGNINIFDNTDYFPTRLKNLNEVGAYLYQKYNVDSIFEVNLASKTTKPIATRATLALRTR